MDEFYDEIDDEQVDDLFQPEEGEDNTRLYEHFRFVADRGQSLLRVDKFLVDRMMGATRNRIQLAADAGCIMANGKPVKSNYRVKPEDVVTLMMTRPPRTFEIRPENIPIRIIYEDDDLLVVNNGVTRWIYKPGEEEIVIASNNPGEEDVLENPFAVLRAGNNGKIKNYTVSVIPRGAGASKELQQVLERIVLTAVGGARYTIRITGFRPLPDIPGAWFELDTKKYPEAVVTDLR